MVSTSAILRPFMECQHQLGALSHGTATTQDPDCVVQNIKSPHALDMGLQFTAKRALERRVGQLSLNKDQFLHHLSPTVLRNKSVLP